MKPKRCSLLITYTIYRLEVGIVACTNRAQPANKAKNELRERGKNIYPLLQILLLYPDLVLNGPLREVQALRLARGEEGNFQEVFLVGKDLE